MAESSPNFNAEVVHGRKVVHRVVDAVIDFARFPRSEGFPSDHRRTGAAEMLDQALDEAPQLPFPGEIGGVKAEPTLLK